ncbi:MAG TPA: AEC family transporter, partial [Candidatus Peribacteria bacterium]|nr:AEC family transporter [Candidatus Peribacteria bacterium]
LDYAFFCLCFVAKFIVWPVVTGLIILADLSVFHLYSPVIHKVMILLSVTPLAANTVVLATALKAQPEKAALAVLLSTVFALFFIPLVSVFFLQ